MTVARRLRGLRSDADLTQTELAREAERLLPDGRTMSMQRYWQIENGQGSAPDDDERAAIATALGVTVADIAWPEFPKTRSA